MDQEDPLAIDALHYAKVYSYRLVDRLTTGAAIGFSFFALVFQGHR